MRYSTITTIFYLRSIPSLLRHHALLYYTFLNPIVIRYRTPKMQPEGLEYPNSLPDPKNIYVPFPRN